MVEINPLVIIDHYKKLERKRRVEFRTKVIEATGMAQSTFYGKISGQFEFTKAEVLVISQLIPKADVTES